VHDLSLAESEPLAFDGGHGAIFRQPPPVAY
jgi:hypothetical protein